mmetsp:Transcript_22580/g.62695  ORF Transcript_22580/g.62695 Transcript_22580/m.62695 type:complete len:509 (+) Transcript_22580:61-1587(+)
MAVLLETSRGDITVDLFVEECPLAAKNFIKLCKIKYYNNCLFHKVFKDFMVQTGDPTGKGNGGSSIYGIMYGEQARFFDDEIRPNLKHKRKGMLSMAGAGENMNASQFFITAGTDLDSLDGKHTIFGEVAEGLDVLTSISEAFTDKNDRPLQNIRIRHTLILDDPFDDPPELKDHIPEGSPEPEFGTEVDRLEDDWVPQEDQRSAEEIEKSMRTEEAKSRAVVLEMIGDLPDADVKPPSSMLFVCKLNPVTTDEDLEIIFSRFGNITSCDIIRDQKTGESLNYAFLGYDNDESAEQAYFKMNNVVIDDRRIKVDFSQSVHHIWKQFKKHGRRGGDASMAQEADQHQRASRQFGSGNNTYELKASAHHRYMPPRGPPARQPEGGRPHGYSMVMDAAEVMGEEQSRGVREEPPRVEHKSSSRDQGEHKRKSHKRHKEGRERKERHKSSRRDERREQHDRGREGEARHEGGEHGSTRHREERHELRLDDRRRGHDSSRRSRSRSPAAPGRR